MISLIFASLLSLGNPTINGYVYNKTTETSVNFNYATVQPVYLEQDGTNVLQSYHVHFGDTLDSQHDLYVNLGTSQGLISLHFSIDDYLRTNYIHHRLVISYQSEDTIYSNLYLNNFYVTNDDSGDEFHFNDVFFNGESDIMDSRENSTYSFDDTDINPNAAYMMDFNLCVFPSNLIVPSDQYQNGYAEGYEWGYADGYSDGEVNGNESLYDSGYDTGYNQGYQSGLGAGNQYSFGSLFASIADTPILIVRSMFDFDFFGVNMLTVVLSLFTALILFYILRKIF